MEEAAIQTDRQGHAFHTHSPCSLTSVADRQVMGKPPKVIVGAIGGFQVGQRGKEEHLLRAVDD